MIYNFDIKDLKKKKLYLFKKLICDLNLTFDERTLIKSDFRMISSLINEYYLNDTSPLLAIEKFAYKDEKECMTKSNYDTFTKINPNILNLLY